MTDWPWSWYYWYSTVVFGWSDAQFWDTTPRKLLALIWMDQKDTRDKQVTAALLQRAEHPGDYRIKDARDIERDRETALAAWDRIGR